MSASAAHVSTTISSAALSSGSGLTYTTDTQTTFAHMAQAGKLTLSGDDADVVVNGKSLRDTLLALEQRLNILVPNPVLEKEWNELKKLGDQYRCLEQDLKQKQEVWNRLKAQQD
jgi:hypothetical protein